MFFKDLQRKIFHFLNQEPILMLDAGFWKKREDSYSNSALN